MTLDKGDVIVEKKTRGLIALVILLSGLALIPFVNLPTEAIGWQRFAGVYDAVLTINYPDGIAGSYFTITGQNFPAESMAGVFLNDREIGAVPTDSGGNLNFIISTFNLDPGVYTVVATVHANATASVGFEILAEGPLRPREGSGPVIYALPITFLPIMSGSNN
jgi:hypothetical protein